MHLLRTAGIAAAASATAVVVQGAAPASAATGSGDYESDAFTATNHERTDRSRVRLIHDACVQRKAQHHADRMARQDRLFHQDIHRVLRECRLQLAGENVAAGYESGRGAVGGWMRSPSHRDNVLEPRYRIMGIAAEQSRSGRWYVAQVFGAG